MDLTACCGRNSGLQLSFPYVTRTSREARLFFTSFFPSEATLTWLIVSCCGCFPCSRDHRCSIADLLRWCRRTPSVLADCELAVFLRGGLRGDVGVIHLFEKVGLGPAADNGKYLDMPVVILVHGLPILQDIRFLV